MLTIMKVAPGPGLLDLSEIDEPAVGPGQVKIWVRAAGLCGTDLHILKDEYKSDPPVVRGHEAPGRSPNSAQGSLAWRSATAEETNERKRANHRDIFSGGEFI